VISLYGSQRDTIRVRSLSIRDVKMSDLYRLVYDCSHPDFPRWRKVKIQMDTRIKAIIDGRMKQIRDHLDAIEIAVKEDE
jgi:hypothetical protein